MDLIGISINTFLEVAIIIGILLVILALFCLFLRGMADKFIKKNNKIYTDYVKN